MYSKFPSTVFDVLDCTILTQPVINKIPTFSQDKKIAISKCGQITGAILQKVCKNTILEKEIHVCTEQFNKIHNTYVILKISHKSYYKPYFSGDEFSGSHRYEN